ncbi:MAG: hypothetical protein EOR78_26025 [Mesorhizobium sp.]|nr:MAG: hypothetical protein EOR49_19265 [Mesorhizobium sp.]RWM46510.1 MAG: hypothetical protein EOR76_17940 [Mesorhizobium sp.]RWM50445.1 MAG: hypothetical protein EOR78_26025 [Mesorhizobium sp.]RWM55520.1 MAG: hypothetical protein EOR79_21460 [Mesorhizobium sp.]RWM77545.1 MAG: hypothetical protein EOR81_17470 [Mesorhizobium sp.]
MHGRPGPVARKISATSIEARTAQPSGEISPGLNRPSLSSGLVTVRTVRVAILRLHDRREQWQAGSVPAGGLFLTAGADIQKDRIEVDVWAWGRSLESWLIEHIVLDGGPGDEACWKAFDEVLGRSWQPPKTSPMSRAISRLAPSAFAAGSLPSSITSSASSPVAMRVTRTALPITSAGRFWPLGWLGNVVALHGTLKIIQFGQSAVAGIDVEFDIPRFEFARLVYGLPAGQVIDHQDVRLLTELYGITHCPCSCSYALP